MSDSSSAPEQNSPFLNAHLSRWARRPYWTPAEIAALSMDKDPRTLNRDTIAAYAHLPDVWDYLDRLDIVYRCAEMKLIPWQCRPCDAIPLLDRYGIPHSDELRDAVDAVEKIPDWKGAFFSLLKKSQNEKAELERTIQQYHEILAEARKSSISYEEWSEKVREFVDQILAENRSMSDELEALRSALEDRDSQNERPKAANDNEDGPTNPKARNSNDLILTAMVIYGYAFDPSAKVSRVPAEIASDIAKLGWELTPETVGKHVRNACKRLGVNRRPEDDG
ncbi:hypothetical protein [Henriciella pelagia]|uniref:Uncharacterized protein n=3 Tax=Henriciella pelagia TaxID=1977912 RepID=A0ABQ1JIZ1_9PROT|nr:hypothetical protein GCM10011503_15380 [Henriciella pelagia]